MPDREQVIAIVREWIVKAVVTIIQQSDVGNGP